jgi:hypothetical protein
MEMKEEMATVEDTPPQPARIIQRFLVEQDRCPVCGWSGQTPALPVPRPANNATREKQIPFRP